MFLSVIGKLCVNKRRDLCSAEVLAFARIVEAHFAVLDNGLCAIEEAAAIEPLLHLWGCRVAPASAEVAIRLSWFEGTIIVWQDRPNALPIDDDSHTLVRHHWSARYAEDCHGKAKKQTAHITALSAALACSQQDSR